MAEKQFYFCVELTYVVSKYMLFEEILLHSDLIAGELLEQGEEVRSRSDCDREVKLSLAHTVTYTDINLGVHTLYVILCSIYPGIYLSITLSFP